MIIYLSHAMQDYGTGYTSDLKSKLLAVFGEDTKIIDPSEYQDQCISEEKKGDFRVNMIKVFYPLIDSSDVLIAVPPSDIDPSTHIGIIYTSGVSDEMRYAERNNIEVYELVISDMDGDMLISKHCEVLLDEDDLDRDPNEEYIDDDDDTYSEEDNPYTL